MKKIICLICSVTLIFGSVSIVSAETWNSYFGLNKGWYEGTKGTLDLTATGWIANIKSIGWGGCWGGQVYQKGLTIKKGKKYRIKFTITSSKLDKWVYLKIGNTDGTQINYAKWLDCKKGEKIKVDKTFKAKFNGDSLYFGLGGDFHDRQNVKTDSDANVRYKYAPNSKLDGRLPSDYSADHPTTITLSNFSFKLNDINLSKTFLVMDKGEKTILKLKRATGKVKWVASNKKIVKIRKISKNAIAIKAKKTGNTTIFAKYKKKKYKCKIAIF